MVNESGEEEKSENVVRLLSLEESVSHGDHVEIFDTWQDQSSPYAVVASGAFRRAIGFPDRKPGKRVPVWREFSQEQRVIIRFVVRDWMCRQPEQQRIFVTGGLPNLGNWQQDKVFELTNTVDAVWEGEVLVPQDKFPFTYKYAINNDKGLILETGESRLASLHSEEDVQDSPVLVVLEDGHFRHEKLWKGSGVAVPVFSLRSERSVGVGEFLDLKLLVDFCAKIGFDVVQILPVNDTSVHRMWWDSYPYSSLSVFALHPIYVKLEALTDELPREIKREIEQANMNLNKAELDYDGTYTTKMKLARAIYELNGMETLKVKNSFTERFSCVDS